MMTLAINSFSDWRMVAKKSILQNIPPQEIIWQPREHAQTNLLSAVTPEIIPTVTSKSFSVSKNFLELAHFVACHKDPHRWDKLYRALWRITHGEKYLLQIKSDILVNQLFLYYKAVRRDAHKMKAFVRFKLHEENGQDYYIAWHKPDHNIMRLVAPFFQRRFSVMRWTIMTPGETASWDGEELIFSDGVPNNINNIEDQLENLWCTYYRAIFNPARVKIQAMKNEMPIRFWHSLPEAAIIPRILQEAPQRVAKMLKEQEGSIISAKDFIPKEKTLSALKKAASECQGCPIYQCARQTVFGRGDEAAKIMIVGEQPGLQEDIAGVPFVGPAGKILREELKTLSVDPETIYLTNAVKHFKNTLSSGKQLHRSPDIKEVNACKPWLKAEIELVQPKVILCLGAIPSKALIDPGFKVTQQHGNWQPFSASQIIAGTYHPAAILRAPTEEMRHNIMSVFKNDLKQAFELASG